MKTGNGKGSALDEKKPKRGPRPETIKIGEDWKEAVKKSLQKKKPKEGWPK